MKIFKCFAKPSINEIIKQEFENARMAKLSAETDFERAKASLEFRREQVLRLSALVTQP